MLTLFRGFGSRLCLNLMHNCACACVKRKLSETSFLPRRHHLIESRSPHPILSICGYHIRRHSDRILVWKVANATAHDVPVLAVRFRMGTILSSRVSKVQRDVVHGLAYRKHQFRGKRENKRRTLHRPPHRKDAFFLVSTSVRSRP